jgi:hypothetical protein
MTQPTGLTVTATDMRHAMSRDQLVAGGWLQHLLGPVALNLPRLLGDMLDEPLTPASLLEAKARFFNHCAGNRELLDQIGKLPGVDKEQLADNLRSFAADARRQIARVPHLLDQAGLTELEALITGPPKPSDEVAEMLRSGGLTIGQLLQVQPGIILVNY